MSYRESDLKKRTVPKIRRLAIIGEAMSQLKKYLSKKYPKIAWKKIVGLRNVVIHEYFAVKIERIWKLVKKDIPKFEVQIKEIRKDLKE